VVTVDQVVEDALSHSRLLRAAGLEIEALAARERQAGAGAMPVISLDARASIYEGLEDASFGTRVVVPGAEERYSISLGLLQPLYTGGKISSLRMAAGWEKESAVAALAVREKDVRLQAVSAYWAWSKAWGALMSLSASVARFEGLLTDARNRESAGLGTGTERLAVEVLLDRMQLRVEDARRQVESVELRIAHLTGKEPGAGARPADAGIAPETAPPEPAELESLAFRNRPERAAAAAAVEASRSQMRVAGAASRPHLGLMARVEEANPNGLFFPPAEEWNWDAFVGAVASWDVFDGGYSRHRVAESAARMAQAALAAEQVDDDIRIEVRTARINLESCLQAARVAARGALSARRNMEAVEQQWKAGLARHSELLKAESDLADAEFAAVAARSDVLLATAAMDRAVGR
jgi:outer membrane protein